MPTTLGKYVLGRELGSGVSCKVKLAKDDNNARYAIKILKQSSEFDELIQTEIDALAALDHPNIIKLFEKAEGTQVHPRKGTKDVRYIVLELAQGGELFDFVAMGGALDENTARFFFGQLMAALKYSHDRGVCHRDLKPENIMLDKGYNVKVADFGFAAPTEGRDGSGLLETQLGTISYMAPEIHRGDKYDGKAVDVFAAAIILFVCMTQRPPFETGKEDNVHYQLVSSQSSGDQAMFWQAHAEANDDGKDIYSAEFKDLFQRMMALDPSDRITVDQIFEHPWMNGPMTSYDDIKKDFDDRKAVVDQVAHEEREQRRKNRPKKEATRRAVGEQGDDGQDDESETWKQLEIPVYDGFMMKKTKFFTTGDPVNYMIALARHLNDKENENFAMSGSELKMKFNTKLYPVEDEDEEGDGEEEKKEAVPDETQAEVVQCTVRLFVCEDEKNNQKHCAEFSYSDVKSGKNLNRDERTLFNFKKYLNAQYLVDYHDSLYE